MFNISFRGLSENLRIGQETFSKIKAVFPNGIKSSSAYETFNSQPDRNTISSLNKLIYLTREIIEKEQRIGTNEYQAVEKALKKTQCGNCYEQAVLVSSKLNEAGVKNNLVYLSTYRKKGNSIYQGDGHTFCVIGLDKDSKISKPETWGDSAVIIDFWSNTIAKADQAIEYFKKILGVDPEQDKICFSEVDLFSTTLQ